MFHISSLLLFFVIELATGFDGIDLKEEPPCITVNKETQIELSYMVYQQKVQFIQVSVYIDNELLSTVKNESVDPVNAVPPYYAFVWVNKDGLEIYKMDYRFGMWSLGTLKPSVKYLDFKLNSSECYSELNLTQKFSHIYHLFRTTLFLETSYSRLVADFSYLCHRHERYDGSEHCLGTKCHMISLEHHLKDEVGFCSEQVNQKIKKEKWIWFTIFLIVINFVPLFIFWMREKTVETNEDENWIKLFAITETNCKYFPWIGRFCYYLFLSHNKCFIILRAALAYIVWLLFFVWWFLLANYRYYHTEYIQRQCMSQGHEDNLLPVEWLFAGIFNIQSVCFLVCFIVASVGNFVLLYILCQPLIWIENKRFLYIPDTSKEAKSFFSRYKLLFRQEFWEKLWEGCVPEKLLGKKKRFVAILYFFPFPILACLALLLPLLDLVLHIPWFLKTSACGCIKTQSDCDLEKGMQTVSDSKTDAETQTSVETQTGSDSQTSVETQTDSQTSVETQTDSQTSVETQTGSGSQTSVETQTGSGSQTSVETQTDSGSQTSVETQTDSGSQTSVETQTGSDSQTSVETQTDSQTSVETQTDSQTSVETQTDSQTSVETQTGSGSQTSVETQTGSGPQTSVETQTDSGSQTSVETQTDSGSQTSVETQTDSQTSVETQTDSQTSVETQTGSGSQTSVETQTGSGPQTSVETQTDSGSQTSVETQTDSGSQTSVETQTGSDSQSSVETQTGSVSHTNAKTQTGHKCVINTIFKLVKMILVLIYIPCFAVSYFYPSIQVISIIASYTITGLMKNWDYLLPIIALVLIGISHFIKIVYGAFRPMYNLQMTILRVSDTIENFDKEKTKKIFKEDNICLEGKFYIRKEFMKECYDSNLLLKPAEYSSYSFFAFIKFVALCLIISATGLSLYMLNDNTSLGKVVIAIFLTFLPRALDTLTRPWRADVKTFVKEKYIMEKIIKSNFEIHFGPLKQP